MAAAHFNPFLCLAPLIAPAHSMVSKGGLILPHLHLGRIPAQTGSMISMLEGNPALLGAVTSKGSNPKEKAFWKCHRGFSRECALSQGRKIYGS